MSPQHLRSPTLAFATKKLSTGANGQKEDAASFFQVVRAVLIEMPVSWVLSPIPTESELGVSGLRSPSQARKIY